MVIIFLYVPLILEIVCLLFGTPFIYADSRLYCNCGDWVLGGCILGGRRWGRIATKKHRYYKQQNIGYDVLIMGKI